MAAPRAARKGPAAGESPLPDAGIAEPGLLRGRSLPELREMLRRQERLLGDRALVSRLPDGGERVRECVARLRAAVRGPSGSTEPLLAVALGSLSLRADGARPGRAPSTKQRRPEDATAACPPPLRHTPAQLLPLPESAALQIRQEEARQDMQAKVAAEKLGERLAIKMVHYEPEGKTMPSYREVRDEEDDSSAED